MPATAPKVVIDCSATQQVGTHRNGAPIIAIVPAVEVVELTPEEVAAREADEAAAAAAAAAALTAAAEAATLRQQLVNLAQSAVGVLLSDLSAAQRNSLVAALLWKAGGVTQDMKVKPLADWLK